TYLNDDNLKKFIPLAAKNGWKTGILAHLENEYIIKGLGLAEKLEDALGEILNGKENHKLDLLFCNGQLVFQSVNIGKVFLLKEENKNNIFSEVLKFLKNIKESIRLSHQPILLTIDGEKIKTSALGIVVVEHAFGSVVSKRLVSESFINDGMFDALILAPENVSQLLWFLFLSLIPNSKILEQTPPFIGQIKTSNLKIKYSSEINFTIDGEKAIAKEINLEVQPEILLLQQVSAFSLKDSDNSNKKILKIEALPHGEKRDELIRRKLPWLPKATEEEFKKLFSVLRKKAELTSAFVNMMILSTLIATYGLFADSSPVVIGAMILAPIISPIVSFSMGIVRYDKKMLKSGIITILIGTLVSLFFAAIITILLPMKVHTPVIDDRLSPTMLDMGIAVVSGIAAAYAHAKEGIAKSLAGVAIAVALVPPLAVAGIGIGWWDWEVFSGAFLLYSTNLSGIVLASGLTFLFLGFAPFKRAKVGLIYGLLIIILVAVPLSFSFGQIKQEALIKSQLEGVTINGVILRNVKVRYWKKLNISIRMVSPEPLDHTKMKIIKQEIENRIDKKIVLEAVWAHRS
ncbi:MAG: DUF389 domain-containing protein, partial [Gillisia sp.]|nr:DUF389 domain-containing protein [Gillisia sp.]